MKKYFSLFVALLFIKASFAAGSTYETGKDGLVIKEAKCPYNMVFGVAVNRTAQQITGKLEVSLLDSDGDFIWRGLVNLNVGPQNGQNIAVSLGAGDCDGKGKRIAFRFLD
jgi:hypothetical protein